MPEDLRKLKKRSAELQVLAAKASLLFDCETIDEVYKTAGEILFGELGYTNSIFAVEGEDCVMKYITISDTEKEQNRKIAGVDLSNLRVEHKKEYFAPFGEKPVYIRELKSYVGGFVELIFQRRPEWQDVFKGDRRGLIDTISDNLFPHIRENVIVSPMKDGAAVAGYLAVFGAELSEEDMPTVQHFSQIMSTAVQYSVARRNARRRLEFEKTVAAVSSRFVRYRDMDKAINASLADIGRLSGAGCAYLIKMRERGAVVDNTYEWCANEVPSQIGNLKGLKAMEFPWWIRKLNRGKIIHVKDVSKMPEDAGAEKRILEAHGIKSLVVIPLHFGTELVGFMGFNNMMESAEWSDESIFLLRICSEIIGNTLQRERWEEALIESEERFRSLFELSPDAITLVGLNGKVDDINPMAEIMGGFSREEVIGTGLGDLNVMPEEDRFELMGLINDAISGREPGRMEVVVTAKDKERRWVEIKVSKIQRGPKVIGIQIISRDITERKRAEEQLKKLSQQIISMQEERSGTLARELHDEVGQQVTAMSLGLELMRERPGADKKSIDELAKIVEGLSVRIRRVCEGLRPMILDGMGLETALASLVWEFKQRGGFEIEASIDSIGENINPDVSIGVYRILQETLTNAARHSGAKKVYVGLRKIDSDIILDVRDDGGGFAEGADESRKGFGLIGMKERAELCGGRLEVKSAPGEGTRVVLGVPINR